MKFSGRIDGSICGTIFLRWPSSRWFASAGATLAGNRSYRARCRLHKAQNGSSQPRSPAATTRGCPNNPCLRDRSSPSCIRGCPDALRRRFGHSAAAVTPEIETSEALSFGSTKSSDNPSGASASSLPPRSPPSKQELLSIVDHHGEADTVEEHLEFIRDPYLRGYAPSNGPNLSLAHTRDDAIFPLLADINHAGEKEQRIIRDLRLAILNRLRSPLRSSADNIYEIYCKLPEPRMSYIDGDLRHKLLRALGNGEKRNSKSMFRYFAVLSDVRDSGFSLLHAEWNTAISFASRYVGTVTDSEIESALSLWREMEQHAGIMGNDVTFNILFDVASKAGNFILAEMIYAEMENRKIKFNRYHHVSLIFFFGLKMDGDGVRAAYREMVEAGEIIDHVVLNCVISSLFRCGEEDAAMRVYERMKASHEGASSLSPRTYATQRAVTKALIMFARIGRSYPHMQPGFQAAVSLAPDLQTYRILVRHYAVRIGRIEKVAQYLDEMKFFGIPVHGGIFLSLFKGFALHGSSSGSDWSPQRLYSVWEGLLQALDGGASGLYVDTWLACWVLRAFERCGQHGMIMDVYDELSARWELDRNSSEFMVRFLYNMLRRLGISIGGAPKIGS